jgi:hypothetical protein
MFYLGYQIQIGKSIPNSSVSHPERIQITAQGFHDIKVSK